MNTDSFYRELRAFHSFSDFTTDQYFENAPSDWVMMISDVEASTQAINKGKYREVNTLGAATIVAARKTMGEIDFPYIFGGDGATILVPKSYLPQVREALLALKELAVQNYGLSLRVGAISVNELEQQGLDVQVAKFEITPGKSIAFLKGAGVGEAEKLIKQTKRYELTGESSLKPDLSGLSCRWNPIPSKKGKILTILLHSRKGAFVYESFLNAANSILPQGIEGANPTNTELASYKKLAEMLNEEKKLHSGPFGLAYFFRAFEIVFAFLIFKWHLPAVFFDAKKYSKSMRSHSDFRKFDDTLKMVLDCSDDDVGQLKRCLEEGYEKGDLYYGTFETESSLMTCFVDGLGQGQHIHFIDALDGGYASAAVELKRQMRKQE